MDKHGVKMISFHPAKCGIQKVESRWLWASCGRLMQYLKMKNTKGMRTFVTEHGKLSYESQQKQFTIYWQKQWTTELFQLIKDDK